MECPAYYPNFADYPFVYGQPPPQPLQSQEQQPYPQVKQQEAGGGMTHMNLEIPLLPYTSPQAQQQQHDDGIPKYPGVPHPVYHDYSQLFPAFNYSLPGAPISPPVDLVSPAEPAQKSALTRQKAAAPYKQSREEGQADAVVPDCQTKKKKAPRLSNSIQIGYLPGLAFLNSGQDGCTLKELYAFVNLHFVDYPINQEKWKKSVRHSLVTQGGCYRKGSGDAYWEFSNKEYFIEKLDAYCSKAPIHNLGLKNPANWESIRDGAVGLPPVVARQSKGGKKRPAPSSSSAEPAATKRREEVKQEQEEEHFYPDYPNYRGDFNQEMLPRFETSSPSDQPFIHYYPPFPIYPTFPPSQEEEQLPADLRGLFDNFIPSYPFMGAGLVPPQVESIYQPGQLQYPQTIHQEPTGLQKL